MTFDESWLSGGPSGGLLVDTNLLVLYAIGTVNRRRIETFKRTRQYTEGDFDKLLRVLNAFTPLCTLPHVLAEVSNLTEHVGKRAASSPGGSEGNDLAAKRSGDAQPKGC
jgi:hypothetical protein